MSQLTLRGLTEDEDSLVLVDPTGAEHRLAVDDALIGAVRRSRSAHAAETPRGEALRPRDIQAMIRQGLSAQEVAEATGEDIEHIRRYEGPVLSERRHTAQQASRVIVYPDSDSGAPAPLQELVDTRLALREVDPETADWDAWKRQDGTWYVELTFTAGGRPRSAGWTYTRGSVVAQDDEARWLSDTGPTDSGPIPDYGSGEERRRTAASSPLPAAPAARPAPARDHQTETGRILESLRRRRGVAPAPGDTGPTPRPAAEESPAPGAGGLRLVGDADDTAIDGAHTAPSRPEDAQDSRIVALPQTTGAEAPAPVQRDRHTEPIGTPRFDAPVEPPQAPPVPEAAETPAAEPPAADGPGSDHPSLLDDPALAGWSAGLDETSEGAEDRDPFATGPTDLVDPETQDRTHAAAPADEAAPAPQEEDEEPQSQRRRGRASVPSWDEIMFGGRGRD
jgi:hypothetical protein